MDNNSLVPGFDDENDDKLLIELATLEWAPGCLVCRLKGYIDSYNAVTFQRRIVKAMNSGYLRLVFDLGALTYLSSTGINCFINFLRLCQQRGGDLVLLDLKSEVSGLFEILGFATFFKMTGSLAAALALLGQPRAIPDTDAILGRR